METNTLFLPGNRNNLLALKRWKVQFHSIRMMTQKEKKRGGGGNHVYPTIHPSKHPSIWQSICLQIHLVFLA